MNFILTLLLSLHSSPHEINVANSMDWLCAHSTTVATVQINSVKEEPFTLMDYTSSVTIDATVQAIYKGNTPLSNNILIYSRLTYVGVDKWKDMKGKEVLVFLNDLMCEQQCAYGIWDDDRGMIPLNSPGSKALTGNFKILNTKEEMLTYSADCIQRLGKKTAQQAYLEVPYETDAFGALYQGSSCHLIVPDVLYPKAKKGMH